WDVDGSVVDDEDNAVRRSVAGRDPLAGRRRVSAAGALIGLLLVLFGFAFVVQLRSNATDEQLSTARPEDLVRILSDLDARQDLRDAGAEALEIDGSNGATVRIVASTWFVDGADGIDVDNQALAGPYWLTAIGDPQTMQTALNIPGGVVDNVHTAGGNV